MPSSLKCRNITLWDAREGAPKRTSIRLEPYMWSAMEDICHRTGRTIHQFCQDVDRERGRSSLTAAIRVAILAFYRDAVEEREIDERRARRQSASRSPV